MKRMILYLSAAAALFAARASASPGEHLAHELGGEGAHRDAAIEYRRLALGADAGDEQGGWYWMAAYEYWRADDERTDDMLDRAEDADPSMEVPALLLRAERAARTEDWTGAGFYLDSLRARDLGGEVETFASRAVASVALRQGQVEDALSAVEEDAARGAVEAYARGGDKSPTVGGLLGMIPGFGYFYSGEIANGIRSMILNGLFIYGMVDTADNEQWGAFTVITFFELTWYSGSIYGGIDAAHRYNRDRLDEAVEGIRGGMSFAPETDALPSIRLMFTF
jgi:hypothetical protein